MTTITVSPATPAHRLWQGLRHALLHVANAFAESRMRRAEIEIEQYLRMRGSLAESDHRSEN